MPLNTGRANAAPSLTVTLDGLPEGAPVAEWDFASGKRYDAARGPRWTLDLPAGRSRAFVIGEHTCDGLAPRPAAPAGERRADAGPFRYELAEPKVCVLDTATFAIDGGATQPAAEVLKVDRAVRQTFGKLKRAGDMIQPWYRKRDEPALGRVRLTLAFGVRDVPTTPVAPAMETPDRFVVTINGRAIETKADGWWVDPAIQRVSLPAGALRAGANELTL